MTFALPHRCRQLSLVRRNAFAADSLLVDCSFPEPFLKKAWQDALFLAIQARIEAQELAASSLPGCRESESSGKTRNCGGADGCGVEWIAKMGDACPACGRAFRGRGWYLQMAMQNANWIGASETDAVAQAQLRQKGPNGYILRPSPRDNHIVMVIHSLSGELVTYGIRVTDCGFATKDTAKEGPLEPLLAELVLRASPTLYQAAMTKPARRASARFSRKSTKLEQKVRRVCWLSNRICPEAFAFPSSISQARILSSSRQTKMCSLSPRHLASNLTSPSSESRPSHNGSPTAFHLAFPRKLQTRQSSFSDDKVFRMQTV